MRRLKGLVTLATVALALSGCKPGPSRDDFLRATDKVGEGYTATMTTFEAGTTHAAKIAPTDPKGAAAEMKRAYGEAAKEMRPLCAELTALKAPEELKRLHAMESDFYLGQAKLLDQCTSAIEKNDWDEFDKRNNELLKFLKDKMAMLADEFDVQHIDSSSLRKELKEMEKY